MTSISANLQAVNARIVSAARAVGRDPATVRLLAVSKTKPLADIRSAVAAGQRAFGENYVQEGVDKIAALAGEGVEWHFIGPLQSNKTRAVAESFDWVHGIDRAKVAERLSAQRPAEMAPLDVCIQVNVSGETSKSGVAPAAVVPLAHVIVALPRLRLRGLMCIPEPTPDAATQRCRFATLRETLEVLRLDPALAGQRLDTLSMGMSHDLEAAIAEGATIVRIGTAIFGARTAAMASPQAAGG